MMTSIGQVWTRVVTYASPVTDADDSPPLLESRADLEAILRQVADGITVQDVEGRLVYANDAAARLVGFATVAEFMATPISEVFARFELFDEDGAPFPLERLPGRLALRGIETEQVIRYRATRTGNEGWSVVRATPVFDEHGAIRFAVNSFRDVTARLLAERDLSFVAEAGQRLNATLDYEETLKTLATLVVPKLASWAGFYLVEDGDVRRMFGAHVDEAKRSLVEETARRHPFDFADRDKPIPLALYEGRSSLFERVTDKALRAAANDEEHFEALKQLGFTTAIVVPLETSGRVIGAMTLVRTEGANYGDADLRVAEELGRRAAGAIENARNFERAQARAHASQALEYVGDGVFLTDAEGVIRLWNPAAAELTGLEAQAVVGLTMPEALPGWPDAQEGGRPQTSPVEVNGRELWLSVSRVDFGEGTVYAFRDLTDDRTLELLKSDFISTVSHELRTPLAAIYGAAMTVRRGGPGIDERRGELLDVISAEAERLARTINDVLWASRLEAGTLHVSIESCDPAELLEGVVAAARTHLPPNLELQLGDTGGVPRVAADPARVGQVLSNLLDNAVKYSPDGGVIRLSVEEAGGKVRFVVRDEGLGIPPGERQRIFEKFYRLDPNLTRGVGGTGLGLYICRELVDRMGGRLSVTANGDRGSSFSVELPTA
jgi:PAS domain S-box-containing protein